MTAPISLTGLVLAAMRRSPRPADRAVWRSTVRRALRDAGSVPIAAKQLGVTAPSLYRWLDDDDTLRDGMDLPGRGRPAAE